MKDSFTLVETIFSVLLLFILTAGLFQLYSTKNSKDIYHFLNNYRQSAVTSGYSFEITSAKHAIAKIKNNDEYKKIIYKKGEMELVRYTLEKMK